jgi:hypothetical protein
MSMTRNPLEESFFRRKIPAYELATHRRNEYSAGNYQLVNADSAIISYLIKWWSHQFSMEEYSRGIA